MTLLPLVSKGSKGSNWSNGTSSRQEPRLFLDKGDLFQNVRLKPRRVMIEEPRDRGQGSREAGGNGLREECTAIHGLLDSGLVARSRVVALKNSMLCASLGIDSNQSCEYSIPIMVGLMP